MKKIALFSIILAFFSIGKVVSQEILFQDDFESYTIGTFPTYPWIMEWDGNDPDNQCIVNDRSVSSSQSLKMEGAPGWAAGASLLLPQTPPTIYCEGYIMVERDYFRSGIGFTNPDIGTWGGTYADVDVVNGNFICGNRVLQPCEAKKWYHVKIKYKSHLNLCDVWIDGVQKGHNITRDTTGEYNTFGMGTRLPEEATKAWFDDIKIYADSLTMMPYIFFTGLYLELTGETDSAKVLIKKALAYIDVNPVMQKPQYFSLSLLRYLHYSAGDIDSVMFYKQRIFEWYNQNGYLFLAMYISNDLGSLYYKNNEVNTAEKYYHQSERIFREMKANNSWYKLDSLNNIVALGTDLIYSLHHWQMKELIWILGKSMYDGLYQINKAKKRIGEAHNYYIAYSNAKDTLYQLQRTRKEIEFKNRGGVEENLSKQDAVFDLRQQIYVGDYKFKQSMYFLIGLGILIILVVILAIVLLRQNKLRSERQNMLLQQKLFRSQMNPHFIFNSLSNIHNYIIHEQAAKAGQYLSKFSKLMRNILDCSVEEFISLEEEVSTIENYLELQKMRFQDKFDFTIEVDEAINPESSNIPPMLLQPFIENSIEHGFKHKETKGNISISFTLDNSIILVELEDDGIGRQKAQEILFKANKDYKSLATGITLERILVLNKKLKNKIVLIILDLKNERSEPVGTRVTFKIPIILV